MVILETVWKIKELTAEEQEAAVRLSEELDISPLAGRILAGRGIRTAAEARAYIRPTLDSLHDPFLMRDMPAAVNRLERAIDSHERIMVYGDYDVDGTTAVALMYSFLRTQTDNLIYYIPDRYKEGYGISKEGIDTAKREGCGLVIALDCGIKAVDKMAYANSLGVDFIICDHHTPGDEIPKAVAVLNMKRKDCLYPYKELSGCGVGFKLVQAYAQRKGIDKQEVYRLLPLLAMSIASDIVPVTGENRVLAFYGLRALNAYPSVGLKAIMQVAGIEGKTVTINDLVYKIGPRINAAGRIQSGAEAVRLLITEDEEEAKQFAQKSAQQKREREERGKDQPMESGRKGAKVKDTQPAGRPDGAVIMGDAPEADKKPVLADSARIKVQSQAQLDSLKHAKEVEDSIDATMKREFVPVTSFIHTVELNNHDRIYQAYDTPDDYFAKKYYEKNDEGAYIQDSIFDKTKYLSIKNTFAIALLEGFNKYMKAGLKGFISYENRNFKMPEFNADSTGYVMGKRTGHSLNVGGQLSRMQGKAFHFNLIAELGVTGMDAGSLALDFNTDVNFRLFGDTVTLAAKAYLHRIQPGTFQESYHSKFLWWDTSLDKETRTHVEGLFSYRKTNTHLRVAVTQIKNYTYFGMNYAMDSNHNRIGLTGGVYQEGASINILTAQLMQNFRLGILNWENVITFQNSSNQDVLCLPKLNVFSNLYLKFKIARVLSTELGANVTYFTEYDAPDYLPYIGQFAVQKNADCRVKLGAYPYVDVYANFHLKRARFFVAMSHVNSGSGNKMYFLTPHYPMNSRTLRFGVSWNFFN